MAEVTTIAVEQILDEMDNIGIDKVIVGRFPNLRNSLKYWVWSPYSLRGPYPSKPVAAGALGGTPAGWSNINGGYSRHDSACRVLERAGYVICDQAAIPVRPELENQLKEVQGQSSLRRTEALRQVLARLGQGGFREALLNRWGTCQVTGVAQPELLRASHIVAWAELASDDPLRVNPDNGLLLVAHWDAAFDAGLISFEDDGTPIASGSLSAEAKLILGFDHARLRLHPEQTRYLQQHRIKHDLNW